MRWLVLPLVAATVLGWSGFLNRLEATTVASTALAEASEEAPRDTQAAAENVAPLPAVARLTTRQADAFKALGDALQLSAERVFSLNDTLDQQASDIGGIVTGIEDIEGALGCVGGRLRALLAVSRRVPPEVGAIRSILSRVEVTQRRSIRHLKSINRKLTALGIVARATDVKAPRAPDAPNIDLPGGNARPVAC